MHKNFALILRLHLKLKTLPDYRNIKINDYSYPLPEERIAKYPLAERDGSKLLVWKKGRIKKDFFRNILTYLPTDSMLIFNNTRVIHARLFFRKETGAKIEIFCLEPDQPADHQLAFQQTEKVVWKCMLGNAKKWKDGVLMRELEVQGKTIRLNARKIDQEEHSFLIEFSWNEAINFAEIIEKAGVLPIPPYLNRETEPGDEETYQTVYAKTDGSVKGWKTLMKEDPDEARRRTDAIIKNTYRTLMTRGQKGCYIYCTDEETAEYFRNVPGASVSVSLR